MANPIALTFSNLVNLARTQGDDTSIVVKNGGFETRGKLGTFFTSKATNRHAGHVLFAAVRQQYGTAVADALAPQMRAFRSEGKPLSARVVRDILADAEAMSAELSRVNTEMGRRFVLGNNGPGDTRNLDTAFEALCAGRQMDPADRQMLKNRLGEAVLRFTKSENGKLLSYQELTDMVSTLALPAMKKAWNEVQVEEFLRDAGPDGADAALDAYAARLGLDDGQKGEMRKVGHMAAFRAAELAADGNRLLDVQTLSRNMTEGSLPELKNMTYAMGGNVLVDSQTQDCLAWATPATAADLSMLSSQLNHAGMGCVALAAQRLGEMRAMQPQGMLTRETIWQGCFGEPLPAKVGQGTERDFGEAMFNRLGDIFRQARPGVDGVAEMGMTSLATGITLDKAVESLRGSVSLGIGDFINLPSLTALPRLGTLREVEASLANDINRRGNHNSLPGYMPTISFAAPGAETHTVRIRDTAGMSEDDKAAFAKGKPSPISAELARRAVELCNGNEVQARQVIQSMGQSGAFLVRTNSPVTGIAETEHSPLDIDIRRQADGSVTMRFYKPENSPLDIDYTYTVTPDGRGVLTACRIQARAPRTGEA